MDRHAPPFGIVQIMNFKLKGYAAVTWLSHQQELQPYLFSAVDCTVALYLQTVSEDIRFFFSFSFFFFFFFSLLLLKRSAWYDRVLPYTKIIDVQCDTQIQIQL